MKRAAVKMLADDDDELRLKRGEWPRLKAYITAKYADPRERRNIDPVHCFINEGNIALSIPARVGLEAFEAGQSGRVPQDWLEDLRAVRAILEQAKNAPPVAPVALPGIHFAAGATIVMKRDAETGDVYLSVAPEK